MSDLLQASDDITNAILGMVGTGELNFTSLQDLTDDVPDGFSVHVELHTKLLMQS